MKYKKSAAILALAAIPAAVTFMPSTEAFAAQKNEAVANYYDGNNYYSSQVAYVEHLINQINSSYATYGYNVRMAHNAYEALSPTQKSQVTNVQILFNALNTYTDYQTINTNFSKKMAAIQIRERSFIRNVEDANRYYNSLTGMQKSVIPTYLVTQLYNYIAGIANMRAVEERLLALNPQEWNYYVVYQSVMLAYNALPSDYRALLSTQATEKMKEFELYNSLEFNRTQAQGVITAISNLSTVSTATEIEQVRALYNKLTVYQQSLVTNSRDLNYIENVLKNPHLGWDPDYELYNDLEEEDGVPEEITVLKKGNSYTILMPISDMQRFSPTTVSVSNNISLKVSRSSIPFTRDSAVVGMAIEVLEDESIQFLASLNNDNLHFSNYVDIEVSGLPYNATILRLDAQGNKLTVPYTKRGTKYIIKTKSSAEFIVSMEKVGFQDIQTDANRIQIEELAKRKIVSGVTESLYQPKSHVTLAQYSTMIARALGLSANNASSYLDVKGKWYESSVQALIEADILDEKKGLRYNAEQVVTRQQAAKIAIQMLKQAGLTFTEPNYNKVPFKDFQRMSSNDRYYVALAYEQGIFGGKSNGNFDPNDKLTRSQMAKVLHKTLQLAQML